MPFQYTNRRGKIYQLQKKTRASGKEGYSFTTKLTGTPVDEIPAGYEVRELPENGQVVLRKIKPSKITLQEKQLVESALRQSTSIRHFFVDVDGDEIVIWLADDKFGPDDTLAKMGRLYGMHPLSLQRLLDEQIRHSNYSKMMRFMLVDEASRAFVVQRWCFRGSVDDWIYLDGDSPLAVFLKKYVPHLGEESFFELM